MNNYHEIEKILTDFKNGATYSDSIEKLQVIIGKARKEGRKEVLDKLDHEQRKFLDGFAHPKDCPDCLTPPPQ